MIIPVDPGSLVTEFQPADDSSPKDVIIVKFELNDEPDKNNNQFFKAQYQIVSPADEKGGTVFENWLLAPVMKTPTMSSGERKKVDNQNVPFARFVKCFKIDLSEGFNINDAPGKLGTIMIKNEEYEGRMGSKVKDYLF